MTFGSDYAIWEPKWQIEGFLDWEMPDEPEAGDLPTWLRRARLVSLSLETNGGMCRDLLRARYREEVAA
jgi:hypothetical protein